MQAGERNDAEAFDFIHSPEYPSGFDILPGCDTAKLPVTGHQHAVPKFFCQHQGQTVIVAQRKMPVLVANRPGNQRGG